MSKGMKGGKTGLVPRLRFPEFWDTGEWQVQKIDQHLTESRLKGSKGDVAKKLTVKLWGNGVYEKQEAVQGSANTQYYRRKAGQFIYSKLDFLNQAFGIIPEHLDNYESTVDLPCFDVDDDLDVRFLLEYVQRKDFYKKYGEIADGGRKAKRIQVETFLDFPIFLPKLGEQQKIAACLSSLDALIAAQADKLDALKTHKKGLMQQLFPREGESIPRLRFPEFRDAGEWVEQEVGDIGEVITGSTPSTANPEYYGGGIPFVSPADISDLRFVENTKTTLTEQGFAKTRQIQAKSILFVCIGSTIGKVAQNVLDCATNQQINSVIPNANYEAAFVYYSLVKNSDCVAKLAGKQAVPIVNKTLFSSAVLHVPELNEQQCISDCLSSLDASIAAEVDKLDALKAHKKGLMQQLFPNPEEADT